MTRSELEVVKGPGPFSAQVLQQPAVQCTPMCMHVTASSFLYHPPAGTVRVHSLSVVLFFSVILGIV